MRFAALALVALAVTAHAEPITLKGLAPGMTKAELEAAYTGFTSSCMKPKSAPSGTEVCGYTTGKRSLVDIRALDTFGGVRVDRWVAILNDDVAKSIVVNLASDDFERVVAALTERWGKPESEKNSVVQNRMGATFDQIETTWKSEGSVLVAKKRRGKVDEMGLYLSTEKFIAEGSRERREDRPKADAKDM